MRPTVAEVFDTIVDFVLTGFFVSLLTGDWNPYNWSGEYKFLWFIWFMLDHYCMHEKWEKSYAQTTK